MHYRISVYNYFHSRFAEEGWEWRVVTNQIQSQNRTEPRFPIEEIPFRFSLYRKRIEEIQPDVVFLFYHLKNPILWPLIHWLKIAGFPFAAWTKTGNLEAAGGLLQKAMFAYYHWISDGLIIYSANLIHNLPPGMRKKAFAANNTINHESFPSIHETKEEIKRSIGVPFPKVVLFVGRMGAGSGRKRVDILIDIFRERDDAGVGLVIVGSGLRPELQKKLNLKNTIYLGEVHDLNNRQISRIFSMADVCAIPEHVGLGLNQALYFGLPVVTMEGNQPPEICNLHSGRNGFIVPAGDISALRRRIFELIDDDALRRRFSAAAREDFANEASIEGMFQGFHRCAEMLATLRHRCIR